jgi:hypothetical protein
VINITLDPIPLAFVAGALFALLIMTLMLVFLRWLENRR